MQHTTAHTPSTARRLRGAALYTALALTQTNVFFGFIHIPTALARALLAALAVLALARMRRLHPAPLALLAACAMSIVVGEPPALFHPWERLALFALLLLAVFPIADAPALRRLRIGLLRALMLCCVVAGITALPCWIAGVNYMTLFSGGNYNTAGQFGGLTWHSMMLGPTAAMGAVVLLARCIGRGMEKRTRRLYVAAIALCATGVLLSASRSAVAAGVAGAAVVVFIAAMRQGGGKTMRRAAGAVLALAVTFPLWSPLTNGLVEKQQTYIADSGTANSRASHWKGRMDDFAQAPLCGVGFASVGLNNGEEGGYQEENGVVEPGSSWLAVLSMTGLCGLAAFLALFVPAVRCVVARARRDSDDSDALALCGLLTLFAVHFIAEGYIYAGGSFMALLFWATLGAAYKYRRQPVQEN